MENGNPVIAGCPFGRAELETRTMRPFRHPFFVAVVTLFLMSSASFARAQCPEDVRLRVQRELDLTDARIERAEMVVGGSDNQAARFELQTAKEIQAHAKAEFGLQHCRIALDLTLRARSRATRAIDLIRGLPNGGPPDPGRVLNQLERTRDLIERARDRIEECDDQRAHALLRAASEMQRRADGAFMNERYLAAFQLTVSARERALRALRLCDVEENRRERAEQALHRTDETIAQAQDRVAEKGLERARQVLSRAVELQDRAYTEFRAEHFEVSLRLTQQARAFAYRSLRLSGP